MKTARRDDQASLPTLTHADDGDQARSPAAALAATETLAGLRASPLQLKALDEALLQFREAASGRGSGAGDVQAVARSGMTGPAGALPYLDQVQAAFGAHDVRTVQCYQGGAAREATDALGAHAYATDGSVVLGANPSLHTVAHEAAHVVQQRSGVALQGRVGRSGDAYERHADAVADAVVAGRSAEALLNAGPSGGASSGAVQLKGKPVDHQKAAVDYYFLKGWKQFPGYEKTRAAGKSVEEAKQAGFEAIRNSPMGRQAANAYLKTYAPPIPAADKAPAPAPAPAPASDDTGGECAYEGEEDGAPVCLPGPMESTDEGGNAICTDPSLQGPAGDSASSSAGGAAKGEPPKIKGGMEVTKGPLSFGFSAGTEGVEGEVKLSFSKSTPHWIICPGVSVTAGCGASLTGKAALKTDGSFETSVGGAVSGNITIHGGMPGVMTVNAAGILEAVVSAITVKRSAAKVWSASGPPMDVNAKLVFSATLDVLGAENFTKGGGMSHKDWVKKGGGLDKANKANEGRTGGGITLFEWEAGSLNLLKIQLTADGSIEVSEGSDIALIRNKLNSLSSGASSPFTRKGEEALERARSSGKGYDPAPWLAHPGMK